MTRVSLSIFKRLALICACAGTAASGLRLLPSAPRAMAQEPAAAPAPGPEAPPAGHPPSPGGAARARTNRPQPTQPVPNSPHGARRPGPRISPAQDLPPGELEVRLTSKDFNNVENQEITLIDSKQSIERGNVDSTLTTRTDARGVARFSGLATESDHIYHVLVAIGDARYSTSQFQFKAPDVGLRAVVPIYESQNTLDNLFLLTRTLIALVPQDDLFVVEVLLRVENYGEISWLPNDVRIALPEGFKALTVRDSKADARFEPDGDDGVKLTGTLAPGQHDLSFRFHLPTNGEPNVSFKFPTSLNAAMVRVILEAGPSMKLEVSGFPEAEESRNQEGQRRLITGRDFMSEKARPPEGIELKVSGIPTPPAGRSVAVGLAAAIALGGVAQTVGRRRKAAGERSDLSKEDRERAGELLLEELISLEQAFQQGAIGRKTYEQAKRQLLEAFARLRAEPEPAEAA
jgi:hypothetical protein